MAFIGRWKRPASALPLSASARLSRGVWHHVGRRIKKRHRCCEGDIQQAYLAREARTSVPKSRELRLKSQFVRAILNMWNIGPQDVVFVDDSAAGLEQVKTALNELAFTLCASR